MRGVIYKYTNLINGKVYIGQTLNEKKREGKFIGSAPCYGYMRDPEDKNHLIPNPETAPIVKKIFSLFVNNVGVSDICSILNNDNVLTPSKYKNIKVEN